METNKSLDIPNESMLLFDKVGITGELVSEINNAILSDCSDKFHRQMLDRKILSSWDGQWKWFKDGFSTQMIAPGEDWKKGKLRLRIVAEFIPDDVESENLPEQSIENPLDTFRES